MKKLDTQTFFSILILVTSILGTIFLTTTAMISNYEDSNNFYRIFFDGRWKWKYEIGNTVFVLTGVNSDFHNPDFPVSFTILTLIGMISIVVGSTYWFIHTISGKKRCLITNYKVPGPIEGVIMSLGGLVGFIGSMIFLSFGNEKVQGANSYAFGYIITTIIFVVFLLVGLSILIIIKNQPTKRRAKKRRR